jgi:endo-alpha-1,4-polygalactosaminidase (GH114 family)
MSRWISALLIVGCVGLLAACSDGSSDESDIELQPSSASATATPVDLQPIGTLPSVVAGKPASWVYWLSDIDLSAIASVSPEAAVIDYSRDGGQETEFSRSDVAELRAAMSGPALVIS